MTDGDTKLDKLFVLIISTGCIKLGVVWLCTFCDIMQITTWKQKAPCIMCTSILEAKFVRKKCALYNMGKYGNALSLGGCNLKKNNKKFQTRLTAIDYLGRKRHSRSSLHSKIADFVLPVTLSSATHLQTTTPFYKGSDPKPTNRNAQERC